MPVVRNQTFVHIMDWLKLASSENGVNSNVFPLVKDVIIAGIIDIWSAIRNTCVAKLSKFLELFTLPQVEEFYQSLVKMCLGKETSWQAKEGAVMCMTAIVCQFLWSGIASSGEDSTRSEGPQYMLKQICRVAKQLQGRKTGRRKWTHKTGCRKLDAPKLDAQNWMHKTGCTKLDAQNWMHKTGHTKLDAQNWTHKTGRTKTGCTKQGQLHSSINPHTFGLTALTALPDFIMSSVHSVLFSLLVHPQLSIREHTTKALSAILSRCHFEVALSSFQEVINRLCHGTQGDGPGQEITQGISELPHHAVFRQHFKFLKAHEAEGLLGVCLFLIKKQQLLVFTSRKHSRNVNNTNFCTITAVTHVFVCLFLVAKDSSNPVFLKLVLQGLAADWKELKSLVCYLLVTVEHHRYNLTNQQEPAFDRLQSCLAEGTCPSADFLMSESWEWREGRLLAYELILKFLITNHIHYVFPTYVLPVSKGLRRHLQWMNPY
ncbi:hypothetical protein OS493_038717 [Desmophyllum pertusum]|uniref:Uncharacterized protein n=1 Tax=Desmophyllum pertusum TaxID=174260 RepID=A0A9X0CQ68_9CNID|nr:hypothetical protein OS493_038717 [Desmophyllum pertusum]